MNNKDFTDYHATICEKMKTLVAAKNKDYAGFQDKDAFANISLVEKMGITSTEIGILTRMTDKFSRIHSFLIRGKFDVDSEKIEDTLIDLANYSIILSAYLKEKANDNSKTTNL